MSKIVTKIRKLLALAEGSEGNEAEVAARIADDLMREHAISLSRLDEAALLEEDPVGVLAVEVGKTTWRVQLAWTLASHCSVSAVRAVRWRSTHPTQSDEHGDPVRLKGGSKRRVFALGYGHQSDLEVWEYLYAVAEREIQKAATEYRVSGEANGWYGGVDRTAMTRFREGAVSGLGRKLRTQREAAKEDVPQSEALAVQSRTARAEVEKCRAHPNLGTYTGGVGGSRDGFAAGGRININPAVRGKKGSRLLEG